MYKRQALTIALTDAVHLQLQIQRLRQNGMEKTDAVIQSLQEVGPACILTSLTTMIGFGSLATAKLLTIQRFGIVCGVSVAISLLAVLALVPALATLLGRDQVSQDVRRVEKKIDTAFQGIGKFAVARQHIITALSLVVMLLMLCLLYTSPSPRD